MDTIDNPSTTIPSLAEHLAVAESTLRQLSALFVAIKKQSSLHDDDVTTQLAGAGQYLADVFADDASEYADQLKAQAGGEA